MINEEELKERVETERDSSWLEQMSLYFPEIKSFAEQDGVTVEQIVDRFYSEIAAEINSKEKPKEQLWGTVVLDIP